MSAATIAAVTALLAGRSAARAGLPCLFRRNALWLFLVCCTLAGCGSIAGDNAPVLAPAEAAPDARKIVLGYLRLKPGQPGPVGTALAGGTGSFFADPKKFGRIELAPPTRVQHEILGWAWQVCLRDHPAGKKPADYTLFISGNVVADVRSSLSRDNCATQTYEPLPR